MNVSGKKLKSHQNVKHTFGLEITRHPLLLLRRSRLGCGLFGNLSASGTPEQHRGKTVSQHTTHGDTTSCSSHLTHYTRSSASGGGSSTRMRDWSWGCLHWGSGRGSGGSGLRLLGRRRCRASCRTRPRLTLSKKKIVIILLSFARNKIKTYRHN